MPVTRFEIILRRPLAGRPAYEELKGRLDFSIDPLHPANRRITDVELAPRNAQGRVEWSSDVSILLPVDRGQCSGRILLDVVNRGNTVALPNFNRATRPVFGPGSEPNPPIDVGDGFLMKRGWVVISCGWQGDLPRVPGLIGMRAPEARDAEGRPLRGRVYTQVQSTGPVAELLLSDRGHVPYPAADLEEKNALLTVRDQPDGPATVIPREGWRFARAEGGGVAPDAGHIHLDGGFEKGRLYQITYTAEGAPVQGLSMAALRDSVAWLKHGGADEGHPAPGRLRWAYGYGRSQTGRLLRTLIYEDLNLDEQGREALDGVIANVAGGMRGEFNQRFGQHSKDRNNMMAHLFPFTDQPQADPETGAKDALHARLDARGSRLRVYYTNTSAEYHRGDASLIHTDPDGARDVAAGPNTRVYHFAGTEHGLGIWPPTDAQPAPADPTAPVERSQNLRGVADYAVLLRACLVSLDRWVVDGIEPPPSRHPRVADGTAVPPDRLAPAFARIPTARYPRHNPRPRRLDWSALPPTPGRAFGSLVSAVDADGNEVAGIVLPEIAVPLAAHTGWNLRHADIGGAEQLLVFAGATIPMAWTRAEREATGDPRLSVAERYASREAYLDRVRQAAQALAREGYLLADDVPLSVAAGARLWDHLIR
ncbi:MAG: alpha/beta hydrolase domain-containing protein [Candidatus Rokuibacteriota bacterium]